MILPRQYDPGVIDPARPVNRDCPLTRGINLWWHFGVPPFPTGPNTYHVPDLTRRPKSRGFLFGTVARVRTAKPGLDGAVTLSGTNNVSTTTFGEADDAFPNTTAATVLLVHRKTDTTLRASMAFGNNEGATTNRIGCHLPWSDGNVYWDWGGSTNNSTRLTVSGLTHTTDWRWWAFTVGGGLGMRAYRDGVLVGSNAATPTRTLTGSTAFFMGRAFNTGDLAEFAECVCFDRALTPGEVWEWAEQSRAGHPDTLTRWNPKQYLFLAARGDDSALEVSYSNSTTADFYMVLNTPWEFETETSADGDELVDEDLEFETETELIAHSGGSVVGDPTETPQPLEFETVCLAGQQFFTGDPTIVAYQTVTNVTTTYSPADGVEFETVTGARVKVKTFIDGRIDLLETARYRR